MPAIIFTLIAGGGWRRTAGRPGGDRHRLRGRDLALLGNRVSNGVRVFLLTIAIVDDIVAILIIALFYGDGLSLGWAAIAGAGVLVVIGFKFGVWRIWPYVPLAALIWIGTYESGITRRSPASCWGCWCRSGLSRQGHQHKARACPSPGQRLRGGAALRPRQCGHRPEGRGSG